MRKYFFISLFFIISTFLSVAQNYTVSGTVKDKTNGETLIGASIYIKETPSIGTITNADGHFSLSLPKGNKTIIAQYIGYTSDSININVNKNIEIAFSLNENSTVLNDIIVSGERNDHNVSGAISGMQKLDMKELNQLPVLFGEKDVLKTIQLLPGVKSNGDGGGAIFVRGGASDQNLMLLDEAVVYNPSHLLGFFSTFNSDAISDLSLYKGTQPAQFGGRLSSVMDIKMKDGNNEKYQAAGSIGLISSKLLIEGPIVKEKGAFLVSGRRTYADLFLKASDDYRGTKLYFYDLNLKANYKITSKDRIYLSGYLGQDKLGLNNLFGMDWGNMMGSLRWTHNFSNKILLNTSASVSNYDYNVSVDFGGNDFIIHSRILDYAANEELLFFINSKNSLRIGNNTIFHNILPGEVSGNSMNPEELQEQKSIENGLYVLDDWKINKHFNINAGVRLSSFFVKGGGKFYSMNSQHEVTDTTYYASSDIVKTYNYLEPRLNFNFMINDQQSLKASYTRNTQALHLLSSSTSTNPTDRWYSSDNNIKPEISDQVSLGYFQNFKDNAYETSIEGYYKYLQNQIDYKDGADVLMSEQVATQLLEGVGRAYGLEFFIKKKTGKLTGWISYTLSKAEKKIDGINNGNWYNARQDKTHDISVVAMYEISPKISLSANWVYSTGNAVTFPSGKYYVNEQIVWLYTERNGYRMPAYHRLDVGASFKLKETRRYSSELTVGIYNLYGRENAYSIEFRENENDPKKTEVVQIALFRWVPSISWNFKIK
jgi:hypothetical protein